MQGILKSYHENICKNFYEATKSLNFLVDFRSQKGTLNRMCKHEIVHLYSVSPSNEGISRDRL